MTGIERIAAERRRQVEVEGYTADHDDSYDHDHGELAEAAACYAAASAGVLVYQRDFLSRDYRDLWPWNREDDRRPWLNVGQALRPPTDAEALRLLEKAGALIAAEIDRRLRAHGEPQ